MLEDPASPFCILPFIHFQLAASGEVFPCCRAAENSSPGSLSETPFEEIWNGEKYREMRKALLAGRALPECRSCYDQEKRGGTSMRQASLAKYSSFLGVARTTAPDGSVEISKIANASFKVSNLCNFRCRSCGPRDSTSWHSEAKHFYADFEAFDGKVRNVSDVGGGFEDLVEKVFPTVRQIHFAGGEPLLVEDHYLILERLLKMGRTDVQLNYNTNLSHLRYRDWDAISLWKKFERVEVEASADGVGAQGELLRKGFDSNRFVRNFLALRALGPPVRARIHFTVSVMNVFHLVEALDFWIARKLIEVPDDLVLGYVDTPAYLSLGILNSRERIRLGDHFRRYLQVLKGRVEAGLYLGIEMMLLDVLASIGPEATDGLRSKFRNRTFALDRLRSEKFVRLFPEHLELLYD